MELPKNIDFKILKGWHDATTRPEKDPVKVIAKKDLQKVAGGLYRIRDDYTSVWSMHDEDGRSYIVRADDESGEKMIVADDQESGDTKTAYRMFIAGDVHIVWECAECDSPNIVKKGETYECDNCHHKTPDVMEQDGPQQAGVIVEEAIAMYGPEVGTFMKKYAIHRIDQVLLEQWARENKVALRKIAGKCEKCGEETQGTKLCLGCSPKGTLFKKDKEASYNKCQSCGHDFAGKYRETCPNCDSPEVKHHAVRKGQSGEKCPDCDQTINEDDECGCAMDWSDSAEKSWKED